MWLVREDFELAPLAEAPRHPGRVVPLLLAEDAFFVFGEWVPLTDMDWSRPIDAGARGWTPTLLVDRRARWTDVTRAAGWIRGRWSEDVTLVFRPSVHGVDEPGPSWLREEAARSRRRDRMPPIGEGERWDLRVYSDCPAPPEPIDPQPRPDEDYVAQLSRRLPDRLVSCGCRVDFEAVKELYWGLLDRDKYAPVASVRISLAEAGEGARVSLPADTPWEVASGSVLEAARAEQSLDLQEEER